MSTQPIEVKSDSIKINVHLCQEYLSPQEYSDLLTIVDRIEEDMKRKGQWNNFDYEQLMSIRSLTSKRMFTGENNAIRGIDVEAEIERIRKFNEGAKKRAKSLVAVSVSVFLLMVAVFTLNKVSEWYPSMRIYQYWLVWCIPCLTTCYLIYLKDFQIREYWKQLHNSFKLVWWTTLVFNLFILTSISFNILGW